MTETEQRVLTRPPHRSAAGLLSRVGELPAVPDDPRRAELLHKVGEITLTPERYRMLNALLNTMLDDVPDETPDEERSSG